MALQLVTADNDEALLAKLVDVPSAHLEEPEGLPGHSSRHRYVSGCHGTRCQAANAEYFMNLRRGRGVRPQKEAWRHRTFRALDIGCRCADCVEFAAFHGINATGSQTKQEDTRAKDRA